MTAKPYKQQIREETASAQIVAVNADIKLVVKFTILLKILIMKGRYLLMVHFRMKKIMNI